MQFMFQMFGSEGDWEASPEEMEGIMEEMSRYNRQMVEAGVLVDGAGLEPPDTAKTVQFDENNDAEVSDGPLGNQHLAGYWVVQTDSIEDAVEWMRKAPLRGTEVEVRPVMGFGEPITVEEFEATEEAGKEALRKAVEERS